MPRRILLAITKCIGWTAFMPFAEAQMREPKVLDFNRHVWASYSGEHTVKGRWGLHFDAQWRRADLGTEWQQFQFRPGVNFGLSPTLLLTAGYAYTRAYPYGDYPVLAAFPEHRIYQQVLWAKRLGRQTLQQRSRLEQRFIRYPQASSNPTWTYQNRFRHLVRMEIALGKKVDAADHWYVPVSNEILFGIPPNYGARTFDQNRMFVGIGKSKGHIKVETGYMNQFIGQRNGRIFEANHTLMFTVTSSASIFSFWAD